MSEKKQKRKRKGYFIKKDNNRVSGKKEREMCLKYIYIYIYIYRERERERERERAVKKKDKKTRTTGGPR